MTRRSSVRAQAREIYREKAAAQVTTPTPNPSPQGGGEYAVHGECAAPDLTARVRALYEDSAVPVREIARLCGVTERTVYKYAQKQRWTPRYRWLAREGDAGARGRGWRPAEGYAAVKGAGGRFIRREDKDQPFVRGLKATDRAGRVRAAAACRRARRLSRAIEAQVEEQQRLEARMRAIAAVNQTRAALAGHLERHRGKRPVCPPWPAQGHDRFVHALTCMLDLAVRRWEALLAEEARRSGA